MQPTINFLNYVLNLSRKEHRKRVPNCPFFAEPPKNLVDVSVIEATASPSQVRKGKSKTTATIRKRGAAITKKPKAKHGQEIEQTLATEALSPIPTVDDHYNIVTEEPDTVIADILTASDDLEPQSSTPTSKSDSTPGLFWLPDPQILPNSPETSYRTQQDQRHHPYRISPPDLDKPPLRRHSRVHSSSPPPPYQSEDEAAYPPKRFSDHTESIPETPQALTRETLTPPPPPPQLDIATEIIPMHISDLPTTRLTVEEGAMTVEEYMQKMIERQCELLREEARRMIGVFKREAEVVRRSIEMM